MAVTAWVSGHDVAERLRAASFALIEEDDASVTVAAENIVNVARFLRDDEELDCKFLNSLAAVDRMDSFEVTYHISSLVKNHVTILRARTNHDIPVVPSVIQVWQGAQLQEREAYDLMGIVFDGHPGLKRIFLWEGFPGHPLRKDFLALPGGFKPGLQRFPFEFPQGQRSYPALRDTDSPTAPSVPRTAGPPEAAIDRTVAIGTGDDPSQAGGTAGESDTHSLPTTAEATDQLSDEPGAGPSERSTEQQIVPEGEPPTS